MELSSQVNDILTKVKHLQRQSDDSSSCGKIGLSKDYEVLLLQDDDFINVEEMDFSNDETWLYEATIKSEKSDITKWLNEAVQKPAQSELLDKKFLDTRTYTRPKKRFLRPSIEQFNEQYSEAVKYDDTLQETYYHPSGAITSNIIDTTKPLYFDLSQPASCTIFDNIMSSSLNVDSFQNMSPPSLINSMCSSTFTNLMENSYIKNDPVLREIRDADYSGEVFLNHSGEEIFMQKSISESCSSLNSDSAENFLKRTLPTLPNYHATVTNDFTISNSDMSDTTVIMRESSDDTLINSSNNLNASNIIEGNNMNNTFKKNITKELSCDMSSSSNSDIQNNLDVPNGINKMLEEEELIKKRFLESKIATNESESPNIVYNSTKTEPSKLSLGSFCLVLMHLYKLFTSFLHSFKGSSKNNEPTFDHAHSENIDPNTTFNLQQPPVTTTKLKSSETFRTTPKSTQNMYGTYKKLPGRFNNVTTACLNETISLDDPLDDVKDRSYIITADRDDENEEKDELLDRMVNIKRFSGGFVSGSNDSLEHGSSRSNSSGGSSRVLNMAEVDAIVEFQERSLPIMSTPKPSTSMSKLFHHDISPIFRQKEHVSDSDLSSTEDYLTSRSTLSKSSGHSDRPLKSPERPVKSMHNLKQIAEPKAEMQPRWAYIPRVPGRGFTGSASNLRMPEPVLHGSRSNLTTIRPVLKGSYTNLRPVSQNLPVITSDPPSLNNTQTFNRNDQGFKVPALPASRQSSAPVNIEKPQARISGLPRPVTGIPRPASRIPGPRSTRPQVQRGGSQPVSKVNLNQGNY
nr:probable serine/threonine-protein kinase DDB_G0282963 isoform X1 [Onthophagus taurus]